MAMNSSQIASAALLSALLCVSSTSSWAGCDDKDRPATPSNLTLGLGNPAPRASSLWALVLGFTQNQTRTGTTYYDIQVLGPDNKTAIPGMGVTGGAGQPSRAGGVGTFAWRQPPRADAYNVSIRARTKGGTEGCVSKQWSETATFNPGKFCWTPAGALVKCGAPLPP